MNYDRIYSTVLLTTSLDEHGRQASAGSYQPTILKLIVIKLSRHKRYYLLIPYSIFLIEENVSSIIDKFIFY